MSKKKLSLRKTESLRRLYFKLTEPLIRDLQRVEKPDDKTIFIEAKRVSVNELIGHIKNMTPIGIEYAEMFLGVILRMSELRKRKKKNV